MKHRITALAFAVLVLALAAFTGSAFAGGNGNGNGNAGGNGNSANAPGHQTPSTQTQAPTPAPAAAPAQPSATAGHGHSSAAHASKQSSTSASSPATGGDNSHGVKPSNMTKHDTYAAASSDQTKQYGNGKTAGQIATQAGYGSATLHGPGNSQPHKTAPCPGSKHEVDVHALKNKASKCGTAASTSQAAAPATSSTQPAVVSTQVTSSPSVVTAAAPATASGTAAATATATPTAAATPTATPSASTPVSAGGVKGAVVALKPTKTKTAGGVLGTTTRLGGAVAAAKLPFTGLSLWIFALVAAALIAIGATVRRSASRSTI
jgi:hypothetical protein